MGATWNCAVDANTSNGAANCPSTSWLMAGTPPPFVAAATATARINNNQSGVVSLDVTSDVHGFLASELANDGWAIKLVNESQTGTLVLHSRESAAAPRLVLTLAGADVPAQAPDAEPNPAIYANGALHTQLSVGSEASVVRPLLNVLFHEAASVAARTAAVAQVEGQVVGGYRINATDGYYVIQVPDPQSIDSVNALLDVLRGLPGVVDAMPEYLVESVAAYRLPSDGTGFGRADWAVLRSEARAGPATVPLVQANLPLAWGCAAGSSVVRLAVVDEGMMLPGGSELSPTVAFRANTSLGGEGYAHGARVASVVAARGDNGTGIAGVMWNSDLRVYDIVQLTTAGAPVVTPTGRPVVTLGAIANRVARAAQDGAQVINLSLGLRRPTLPSSLDSAMARSAGALLARVLRPYASTFRPVMVISAGNQGVDAWWNGFAQVADSLPEHVIVVAANNRAETQLGVTGLFTSNTGPLPTIAATGDSVLTLSPTGAPQYLFATSFAAPLVSGTIGLVLAFDSRLSPREALGLVKAGASRTGRTVGGLPTLDAREALVAAAERSGAPLCGNWVRWDAGTLVASRGSNVEALGAWLPEYGLFSVEHDGRIVSRAGITMCQRGLEWSASGWIASGETGTYPCTTSSFGAMSWSSHDRDSSVSATYGGGGVEIRLHQGPDRDGVGALLATVPATFPQAVGPVWATGGDIFVLVGGYLPGFVPATGIMYRISRRTGAIVIEMSWPPEGLSSSSVWISDDRRYFAVGVDTPGGCTERLYAYPSWALLQEVPRGCDWPDLGQRFAPAAARAQGR